MRASRLLSVASRFTKLDLPASMVSNSSENGSLLLDPSWILSRGMKGNEERKRRDGRKKEMRNEK